MILECLTLYETTVMFTLQLAQLIIPQFSFAVDDKPAAFEKMKPRKHRRAPPPPNPFGPDDEEEETIPVPPACVDKTVNPFEEPPSSDASNPFGDEDGEVSPCFFICFVVVAFFRQS